MDLPARVEEPRITRTNILWLVFLVVSNIAAYLFWADTGADPEQAPRVTAQLEPSLRLLSELSEAERNALTADAAPRQALSEQSVDSGPAVKVDPMVCRVWGPFDDRTQLESLQNQLADLGGAIEIRESEIQGDPDYLVYIDTGNNLDTARRTLQELETQSVDAYIIAGGPYINSVSVGVFSREPRAEAQKQRVSALGYKSAIAVLGRSQTVFHLIARVPVSPEALEDPGADCQTIASIQ
jgi:hypothetical protein